MASVRVARRARTPEGSWVWDNRKPFRYYKEISWVVLYRSNGRGSPERSLGTFTSQTLADQRARWARECLAKGKDPRYELVNPQRTETLAQAATRLRAQRLEAGRTIAYTYDRAIASLGSLGRIPIQSLAPGHFREWLAERTEAQSTKLLYLTQFRVLLDLVGVDPNPARHHTVKVRGTAAVSRNQPGWVPSRRDFERLCAALTPVNARIARLMEASGLRSVELNGLERGHIDLATNTLWVHVTKRRADGRSRPPRAVPITSELRALLIDEFRIEDLGPRDRVLPKKAQSAGVAFTRISHRLNISPGISPHGLRRRYISRLGRAVVPISEVSRIVGHEKSSVTLDIYTFPLPDEPADRTRALHDEVMAWLAARGSMPGIE
jgi:integrase